MNKIMEPIVREIETCVTGKQTVIRKLLTALLVSIGVDADIAEKDACRVEHDLSPETFEAIRARYSAGE